MPGKKKGKKKGKGKASAKGSDGENPDELEKVDKEAILKKEWVANLPMPLLLCFYGIVSRHLWYKQIVLNIKKLVLF